MTYCIASEKGLRVGQRVCRVEWKKGIPAIRIGRITRVTTKGGKPREVDGHPDLLGFTHSADAALRIAYRDVFDSASRFGILGVAYAHRHESLPIRDAVRKVSRLRRLERRLFPETEMTHDQ